MKFLDYIYIKKLTLPALMLLCVAGVSVLFTSCDDDEEGSTGEIQLQSFGPSPAMRGGKLKFIGTNLDKVTAIVLPQNVEVTTFETKTSKLIEIEIPEATVEGQVTLKTPQGDIVTKTSLGIAEPITIASISPATARPGDEITIEGTYLNLVAEVIFADNKSVTDFESQSQTSLTVIVPEDAQTGTITLSDGEEEPNLIESDTELTVALPAVTSVSPATVKASSDLTITGTNLDLVKDITFKGGLRVESDDFVSQSGTEIVVTVPANSQDGVLMLRPASLVEVESPALTMAVPTITAFDSPGKNNGTITITGTNLDLVTGVEFGGDTDGEIQAGGTATSITVKVPADAEEGTVTLNTGSGKTVSTATPLALVVPTITNFTPASVNTVDDPSVTINGTHLDIVDTVVFAGNWKAPISEATSASQTQIVMPVVHGSVSGEIKLITTNGTVVTSTDELTIVPDVPNVTGVPASGVNIGDKITLTGTNMNVPAVIYFPSEKPGEFVVASQIGLKTSTTLEVYVPAGVASGDDIKVRFVTFKKEVYESPAFTILSSLPVLVQVFYDDQIRNGFGQWGGNTDWNNTEQVRTGTSAMKLTFGGGDWGIAGQFGGSNVSTSGATHFVFSAYGGPGTGGAALQLLVKRTGGESSTQVTLVEGQWTDFQVPFSAIGNPGNVVEFFFQDPPGLNGVVYLDHVGLK